MVVFFRGPKLEQDRELRDDCQEREIVVMIRPQVPRDQDSSSLA